MKNKIIAVAMVILVILVICSCLPVLSVSASATGTVNQWTNSMWSKLEADPNFLEYRDTIEDLDVLEKLNEKDFICFLGAVCTNYPFFAADTPIVDFYQDNKGFMLRFDNLKQYYDFRQFKYLYTENTPTYSIGSNLLYYSDYSSLFDSNSVFIVNDLNIYNQIVNHAQSNGFDTDNIYYCADPVKSFKDYINGQQHDFNPIVPPEGFNKNAIKYSDFLDCPYGKYGAEPYGTETENYVTSGLFTDLDLYYHSTFPKGGTYEHNEDIAFYIPLNDEAILKQLFKGQEHSWTDIFQTDENGLPVIDFNVWYRSWYLKNNQDKADWDGFFNTHFRSVHYEKDVFTPLDFFNDVYNTNKSSMSNFFTLASAGDNLYIKFTLGSHYSITHTNVGAIGGSQNITNNKAMFLGTRITHTATIIDPETGETGKNKDGLGSDISQADDSLSRPPTKDELKDLGFDYGYPNTKGDFPYAITIYRNGVEYFRMQFNKKPSVTADYFTDKCIKYGFNVDGLKMYMYFKEQNMSKYFDFSAGSNTYWTDEDFDENKLNTYDKQIINSLLNIDASEFSNTYTLYAWTNYTGEFPDNYNGFYVKFNWDLETSGHFQKNNSDDDYDYSQDYKKEDPYKDNNGNVQGGGDDGAALIPTEPKNDNSSIGADFDFSVETLTTMVNDLLVFIKSIFSVFPQWVWACLLVGLSVIVVLRILGR